MCCWYVPKYTPFATYNNNLHPLYMLINSIKTELGVVGPKKDEMVQWPSYKKWDLISQSRLKQEFDKTKVSIYNLDKSTPAYTTNAVSKFNILCSSAHLILYQAANKTKTKRSVVDTPEFYVTALKTKPDGITLKVQLISLSPLIHYNNELLCRACEYVWDQTW